MLCPATSTGMDGGGGGRVGYRAGQAGLASCLMTSLHLLPQWAPTNLPPCSLGTMGSCRELSGAVSPAASPKSGGRGGETAMPPCPGPQGHLPAQCKQWGRPSSWWEGPHWGASLPLSASSRALSQGVPLHLAAICSSWWGASRKKGQCREHYGVRTCGFQSQLCHCGRDGQLSLIISPMS